MSSKKRTGRRTKVNRQKTTPLKKTEGRRKKQGKKERRFAPVETAVTIGAEEVVSDSLLYGLASQPRIVKPGDYVYASARVVSRHQLFRPDKKMTAGVEYMVAKAAEQYGIEIFACVLTPTQLCLVYRDVRALRAKFHQRLHRELALFTQAHRGWTGQVFAKNHKRARLHGYEAVVDKIGSLLATPVAAGAVRYAKDWPGVLTRIRDMGKKRIGGTRPDAYFGERKTAPAESFTELRLPPILLAHCEGNEADARAILVRSRDKHIAEAHAEIRNKGWRYTGAERCKKLDPFERAIAYDVFGRSLPPFACEGLAQAEQHAVIEEYETFMSNYARCREALLRQEANIVWPAGTWKMVHDQGARAAPCAPV